MKMRAALPLVLLPSFLTACDGSAPGLAGLEVGATALVFEDVEPGSEVEKSAALRNVGERRIVIDRAAVAPAGLEAFFPVLRGPEGREQQPLILGPGEEGSVAVTFRPRVLGPLEATLRLNVSDASDVEIALSGSTRLNPCGLRVEPDSVIFDNVLVGSTKTLALSVTNECEGRAEVLIGTDANVRLCEETEGANLANFCLTSRRAVVVGEDRRFELEGGATADFQVRFSPVVGGTRSRGQLTFQTCGSPICRIPVDLQGFGVESGLRCRPPTLDFGRVIPGGSSSESVVCENIANEQATIVSWDLSQDSHPAFEAERSRPQVLEAGDSASIEVTFSPLALSEVEGTLQIVTDHPNPALRNLSVALTGTGGGANLQVLPTSGLNFGEVALIAPGRRSFAITNTGFAPVTLLEIQVDTLGTQAFSSPNANPNVLSPGESLLVTIEFGPRAVGAVQSFIRVVSDSARQGVVEIPVRGVGVSLPPCQFNLSPDLIDFGDVVRSRSSRQGLRVLNEGNTDCLITGIRLMAGSDPAFRLAAPESPSQRLSPGEAKVIFLDFAPHAAGRVSGRIEVSISTPSSPHNVVELAGTGVDDGPLIAPSVLDFGARETSCGARRELRIHNTGAVPLVLDRIGLAAGSDAAGFSLSNLPFSLPANVAPGFTARIDVVYRAGQVASDDAGAIEIEGRFGGASPAMWVVPVAGQSGASTQVDSHEQLEAHPQLDLLVVMDGTASMVDEQGAVAEDAVNLLSDLDRRGVDYQLGVISTNAGADGGRLLSAPAGSTGPAAANGPPQNRIVRSSTPNAGAAFASNHFVVRGNGSSLDESGLRAAQLALSSPAVFGHNAGFLRSRAGLSILFVSDEPEQSDLLGGGVFGDLEFYLDFFRSLKGSQRPELLSAHAITAGQGTCTGPGGTASSSGRYLAIAEQTQGGAGSICSVDWAQTLSGLRPGLLGYRTRFPLSQTPVLSSLQVFVDGSPLPATSASGQVNWTYSAATNTVDFMGFSTPEPGTQLRLEYTPECL